MFLGYNYDHSRRFPAQEAVNSQKEKDVIRTRLLPAIKRPAGDRPFPQYLFLAGAYFSPKGTDIHRNRAVLRGIDAVVDFTTVSVVD